MLTHNLGFPRIGRKRELKKALEAYWQGEISQQQLLQTGSTLRQQNWQLQADAGIDLVPVGDFAWYDHVLATSLLLGVVPERHRSDTDTVDLNTLFRIARGRAAKGKPAAASDMTKWFNTNYHYIVPEFAEDQAFVLTDDFWFEQIAQAQQAGVNAKPVLLGPLSYLYLGKSVTGQHKLALLPQLLQAYQHIFDKLNTMGISWLQIDEPILVLELDESWCQALAAGYRQLQKGQLKLLLASYFGEINHQLPLLASLPLDGLHLDLVADSSDIAALDQALPPHWVLSAGVINGRNVWRSDLTALYRQLAPVYQQRADKLWLAPSCSLLHCPVDLELETALDSECRSWFAFAKQKCQELALLKQALQTNDLSQIEQYSLPVKARAQSARVNNPVVQHAVTKLKTTTTDRREPFAVRQQAQRAHFKLPLLPTTTIGSFPQTADIRQCRLAVKTGKIDKTRYQQLIQQHIQLAIAEQEQIGLDVLVHGEAERNDMVEYFGELLDGFVFSQFGWVQSYGSRCVKPPIIIGDISRPQPMTVEWSRYAQSLTSKPVKGMLTGPVTILGWSFPRDDISRQDIALQLSLALAAEVQDLQAAGIDIIQIDEPAFREGLPLKHSQWQPYLDWAVAAFKLCCHNVRASTQIHTHMCYSEFNDIIEAIAALDADVITIETSRSNMELLSAFEHFAYPNEIGPGVYDIHSPNVPTVSWIKQLVEQAATKIPAERLWVNPDCGLKTRGWNETRSALVNMVKACKQLRSELL
ncbi:5-methyltetrahydropteroyltriglutamate--homocysteine methyltransferase [Arsukibacterium ikkense]|uniref:5-methyltetrahydropteroyltriglutamate--homocysteine methyltransferase n=1 Tax=Arsukibacterium ikkense TaxID=336831 RepID=A0A0M2V4D2_9GAMM|nr:5-methyltetrahydropteroyltriglutamate--homocysteine S-methyltransferase [Arsukibacterium ikkense]KKO44023.1 5-methyltetrahydropteroyltriglutamate--homocysteine methyltransferase [Arsukibacterium ikkense]